MSLSERKQRKNLRFFVKFLSSLGEAVIYESNSRPLPLSFFAEVRIRKMSNLFSTLFYFYLHSKNSLNLLPPSPTLLSCLSCRRKRRRMSKRVNRGGTPQYCSGLTDTVFFKFVKSLSSVKVYRCCTHRSTAEECGKRKEVWVWAGEPSGFRHEKEGGDTDSPFPC